jgi:hypothetical protein
MSTLQEQRNRDSEQRLVTANLSKVFARGQQVEVTPLVDGVFALLDPYTTDLFVDDREWHCWWEFWGDLPLSFMDVEVTNLLHIPTGQCFGGFRSPEDAANVGQQLYAAAESSWRFADVPALRNALGDIQETILSWKREAELASLAGVNLSMLRPLADFLKGKAG